LKGSRLSNFSRCSCAKPAVLFRASISHIQT
jgi:hypothetical protein